MVLKTKPMPQSGKQQNAENRAGLNSPQHNHQQPRSRGQARTAESKAHSLNPESARSRSRSLRSVELPPRANRGSGRAGYDQSHASKVPAANDAKPNRVASPQKSKKREGTLVLYALRLLILGVGISAIAGTVLSAMNPTTRSPESVQISPTQAAPQEKTAGLIVPASPLKLTQEVLPLKTMVQQLAAKNNKLVPGVFFVELDTGAHLDWNGDLTFSAASTIKFPILVAFFQAVDAKKIRLDEKLTLKKELIGGGSGDMQYKPLGTKFTALEVATKMIAISDNTATNMLIERLGGATVLNQRFQKWGLMVTEIKNPLPDLPGTNTTSPKDLAHLMALVDREDLLSTKSRDRLLDIMEQTVTKTLLPKGLGPGATIAHKTGDIGSLVGDVGLVDTPNGKRYIAVAMVKRPHNNSEAKEWIRQISRAAYQKFSK